MKRNIKRVKLVLLVLFLMLVGFTKVFAEGTYTITIDPNGGIPGEEYQETITLEEEETYPVNGDNEAFLKAPEGKGFSGIEMFDKDGELVGTATGVLLWGDVDHDGMVLKFHWGDLVDDVNLTLEAPEVGSETTTPQGEYGYYETDEQTNKPKVTIESEYGFEIAYLEWVDVDSYVEEYEYYDSPYIGTFESGQKYYALVDVFVNSLDYALSDSPKVNISGDKANVYKVISYSSGATITLEVEIPGTTYEVTEGANQEVATDEEAEFEIDADYNLFKEGGEVYVDDNTKPLETPKDYTSKEGSTIITLTDTYISSLSAGEHALKVVFNDGNIASTSFTVTNNTIEEDTDKEEEHTEEKEEQPPHTKVDKKRFMFYIPMLGLIALVLCGKNDI